MLIKRIAVSKTGIETYELTNVNGCKAQIITFGARIHKLFVPDRNGKFIDIVAGFDDPEGYRTENPYFNAVIGRVVNRIGNARFTLNGKTYDLCKNDGGNCLHGGKVGFDSRIWEAKIEGERLVLSYFSPAGEENFPANLSVKTAYSLTDDNSLKIEYYATSDGDTPFNPTNHAYFNLDGDFKSVSEHVLFLNADKMTESNAELIATGKILDVKGTPFDFTVPHEVGKYAGKNTPELKVFRDGYDNNFIINKDNGDVTATVYSARSGIKMTVKTDRPCVQLYTGNFLDGSIKGKFAFPYQSTICLETQGYPNAVNVPSFPSSILKKGDEFYSVTSYTFVVEK